MLYGFLMFGYVGVCLFLILIILLRRSEGGGGGLSGAFGGFGGDSPFGVRTMQTLDRVIAGGGMFLALLALIMAYINRSAGPGTGG